MDREPALTRNTDAPCLSRVSGRNGGQFSPQLDEGLLVLQPGGDRLLTVNGVELGHEVIAVTAVLAPPPAGRP